MEFMQLEMFVAVVEQRTLRAAAVRVFRTQPAVSMAIRKLEEEIGEPLFRPRRSGRLLTETGEVLYLYARKLLELRTEALSAVTDNSAKLRSQTR
jgi:DNA-binding transcriptional LysR family regulator